MKLSSSEVIQFQQQIFTWYSLHRRDLPWRHTDDPYKILLSEIMSQQTQIGRVVTKYTEWLVELPTIEAVAQASQATILRLWSGLGYNRRALYLHQFAKQVVEKGYFPSDEKELLALSGIGRYTASAVLCFAFHKQIPVIDTNIRKVIAVHFFQSVLPKETIIEEVATQLLPRGRAEEWNQALMDYASSELRSHKIPIPKQSRLLGSNRYYRGQTIKYLVKNKSATLFELLSFFETLSQAIEKERYEKILSQMQKEGFVHYKKETITLA